MHYKLTDPQGRLVLCQHGDRRIARLDAPLDGDQPPAAKFVTLADRYQGKRFKPTLIRGTRCGFDKSR
jgi:hypothetical protein